MRPTIYITSEDPMYDYSRALDYGEKLVGVFPPGQIHLSPGHAMRRAEAVLSSMRLGDYLALAGDPVKIGICSVIVARRFERVKFLRWNRQTRSYLCIEVDFSPFLKN